MHQACQSVQGERSVGQAPAGPDSNRLASSTHPQSISLQAKQPVGTAQVSHLPSTRLRRALDCAGTEPGEFIFIIVVYLDDLARSTK
jgi:hypothetical protein